MNTKLFVSFTGILKLIRDGKVTEGDLANGIFFFGCSRKHAFEPWNHGETCNELSWAFGKDSDEKAATHRMLKDALVAAEKNGRCEWRSRESTESDDRKTLSDLLERNGFSISFGDMDYLNYPGVEDKVKASGLALEVAWR